MSETAPLSPPRPFARLTPWTIAIIYATFAGGWLLLSGPIFDRFAASQESMARVRTIEGLVFVILSSALILGLAGASIRRFRHAARALEAQLRAQSAERDQMLARYEAVLDSIIEPLIIIDARGTIVETSASVTASFGWDHEDLIGRNIRMLMPESYAEDHDAHLARYRSTGITSIIGEPRELEALRRDGSIFPIELTVWRVDVPGRDEPLFTGILRDITERRAAESELRAHRENLESMVIERTDELNASHEQLRLADRLATIGTLAAGLGHDMNNVLLPVRCRLDALDVESLTPAVRDHLDAVRSSVDYLQQLTDGMHLLASDPDEQEISGGVTEPGSWWRTVEPLLKKAVPRSATFTATIPAELPPITVPAHRLTQAVLNLVVNAAEAIDDDGRIDVTAAVDDDGTSVRLRVADDGYGMTDVVRHRALDPFFTTKTRGLGTGLGLALVHGTMRAAGGALEIDSAPNEGTTITLRFAIVPSSHPDDADGAAPRTAAITVDDPRVRSVISTLLGIAGVDADGRCAAPPDTSILWVIDDDVSAGTIEAWLGGDVRRRVLRLSPAGTDPRPRVITAAPDDFEALRDAIGRLTTPGA